MFLSDVQIKKLVKAADKLVEGFVRNPFDSSEKGDVFWLTAQKVLGLADPLSAEDRTLVQHWLLVTPEFREIHSAYYN